MKYSLGMPVVCFGALLWQGACTQIPTETAASRYGQRKVSASAAAPVGLLTPAPADSNAYEIAPPRDFNGIGKYYQGRQIAHVMGHEGADWLERSGRREEEGTDLLLKELTLEPTDVVADIGAGTGFFSFQLARKVPQGQVLAVDIQPEMIAELNKNKARLKLLNVRPVLGTVENPHLPADSVDLVLIVDAYHEFDHPREMGLAIARALRPGTGRLALVEYRAEDPECTHQADSQDERVAGPQGDAGSGPGTGGSEGNPAPTAPDAVSAKVGRGCANEDAGCWVLGVRFKVLGTGH